MRIECIDACRKIIIEGIQTAGAILAYQSVHAAGSALFETALGKCVSCFLTAG